MPTRGTQDYHEYKKKRAEKRRKDREKLEKWCQLAGLTIVELFLCLICFLIAYGLKLTIGRYINIRLLMFTTLLIVIACVYFVLTCVDLISWISVRPITYFAWITVATSGFILFGVYAGICLFYTGSIVGIMGIVFGCITSLVFLADLICSLLSLKRFPIPHWLLKRKFEKWDECVCTGDYDPTEEKEIERPICRCGDTWGEPCTCDAEPDTTCGCGAEQMEEPPCPCCSCSTQALVDDDDGTLVYGSMFDSAPRKSIVSTATGRDYILEENEDPTKSTLTQVTLIQAEDPDAWCVSGPSGRRSTIQRPSTFGFDGRASSMYEPRKSIRSTRPSAEFQDSRKSTVSRSIDMRKSFAPEIESQVPSSRMSGIQSRKSLSTRMSVKSELPTYSVYTTTVDNTIPRFSFESGPSSILRKSVAHSSPSNNNSRKLHFNSEIFRSTLVSGDGPLLRNADNFSTDDEYGEGDYPRNSVVRAVCHDRPARKSMKPRESVSHRQSTRYSTYTSTDFPPISGAMSDPEWLSTERKSIASTRDSGRRSYFYDDSLPGQVSHPDDVNRKSTTSRMSHFNQRPSMYQRQSVSARSDHGNSRTLIRNVSTTVRPIRTLSSVLENSQESVPPSRSRTSHTFPSECTITINKNQSWK